MFHSRFRNAFRRSTEWAPDITENVNLRGWSSDHPVSNFVNFVRNVLTVRNLLAEDQYKYSHSIMIISIYKYNYINVLLLEKPSFKNISIEKQGKLLGNRYSSSVLCLYLLPNWCMLVSMELNEYFMGLGLPWIWRLKLSLCNGLVLFWYKTCGLYNNLESGGFC